MSETSVDPNDQIVGYHGAHDVTGLKLGTLYAMVKERRIPHVRLGPRLVRFSVAKLRAWMEANSVAPTSGR